MDIQAFFKQNKFHFLATAVFFLLAVVYFSPSMSGKVIDQYDIVQHNMKAHELKEYRAETGKEALWTNSMFGGMPGYMMSMRIKSNLVAPVDKVLTLFLPKSPAYLFLYMLGFYFLAIVMKAKPLQAAVMAVAYGFGSYLFLNLEAGHNTKVHALAYMAPTLAGFILITEKKYIVGTLLMLVLLSLQIYFNHLQITYYTFLAAGLLFLVDSIFKIKAGEFKHVGITLGGFILATLLAFSMNSTRLMIVQEYSKETTRGGASSLSSDQGEDSKGVGRDYAYGWSYGVAESWTLIYPMAAGGGGRSDYSSTNAFKTFKTNNPQAEDRDLNGFLSSFYYWGDISSAEDQPRSTAGTIYIGAILWFFVFISLVLSPWDKIKYWLLGVTFFSLVMSWGRYFPSIIDLFFNYFPFFDKFRVPMMFLTVTQLGAAGLALLGIRDMFSDELSKEAKMKALKFGGGAFLGLGVIMLVMPGIFLDFSGYNDALESTLKRFQDYGLTLDQIIEDRKSLFRSSVLRTTAFGLIAGGLCWAYVSEKFKNASIIAAILLVLVLVDEWTIARPYLNEANYVTEAEMDARLNATPADNQIIQDGGGRYYRVFNIANNPLAYSGASYYHSSISGYHAAKLQRWQDFAENLLMRDWQMILANQNNIQGALAQAKSLNMFNVQYLITDGQNPPIKNNYALGNAWFVRGAELVKNADSAIALMQSPGWDPAVTAVFDASDKEGLTEIPPFEASGATDVIELDFTAYEPNYLKYNSNTSGARLVVFSEVYYRGNEDWNAYIDGEKVDHYRVNFLQRAVVVPAGEHMIEFKFEPPTYKKGNSIALAGSGITLLLILAAIGFYYKKSKSVQASSEAE